MLMAVVAVFLICTAAVYLVLGVSEEIPNIIEERELLARIAEQRRIFNWAHDERKSFVRQN